MPLNPFSSLTFLSGASLAPMNPPTSGLNNTNPPAQSAAFNNTNPPAQSAAFNNTNPPAQSAAFNNMNPPRAPNAVLPGLRERNWPVPTPAPVPWTGQDPDWVYADASAVLGQALRRSRAKIVRVADQVLQPAQVARAMRKGEAAAGSNLWRWEPEFRVKTVACELITRFQVHGQALWHVDPSGRRSLDLQATRVFELPAQLDGADLDDQVDKVLRAAAEREDRLPEILAQAPDFWAFFESLTGLQLAAAPFTTEMLTVAHEWMLHLVMLLKHAAARQRPVQRSSLVMPVIGTPGHGSLPSGHATTAAFTSELLHIMLYRDTGMEERSHQLDRLARRIAFNRVVAGVHFPVDSQCGYRLGTQLARLFWALSGHVEERPAPLSGRQVGQAPYELVELRAGAAGERPVDERGDYPLGPVATLRALRRQVDAELQRLRV